MKILIINAYTPANLGDGAIALAMISEARRVFGEAVEIEVSATDPAAFETLDVKAHRRLLPWRSMGSGRGRIVWLLRNLPTIFLLWWGSGGGRRRLEVIRSSRLLPSDLRGAIGAYLWADLVLAAGGGYLGDAYRRQLPFWHLEYRCAGAAAIPLVFFSQSVGSTKHVVTRVFLRKALDRCSLFIARDRPSVDHLTSLGRFDDKIALCPDVALVAINSPPLRDSTPEYEPYVAVSLMRWQNYKGDPEHGHRAYLAAMEEALKGLLEAYPDLRLRLYATNAAIGVNNMDDVSVSTDMWRRLSGRGFADRSELAEWTAFPDVFMRDVSRCDLMIATRTHAAILALNVGVPVVGIAYEEKMRGVMDLFEMGDEVVDIEAPESMPEKVRSAYDRRIELRATVARLSPDVGVNAARAMELSARVVATERASRRGTA